jgi:hypothetical protein
VRGCARTAGNACAADTSKAFVANASFAVASPGGQPSFGVEARLAVPHTRLRAPSPALTAQHSHQRGPYLRGGDEQLVYNGRRTRVAGSGRQNSVKPCCAVWRRSRAGPCRWVANAQYTTIAQAWQRAGHELDTSWSTSPTCLSGLARASSDDDSASSSGDTSTRLRITVSRQAPALWKRPPRPSGHNGSRPRPRACPGTRHGAQDVRRCRCPRP